MLYFVDWQRGSNMIPFDDDESLLFQYGDGVRHHIHVAVRCQCVLNLFPMPFYGGYRVSDCILFDLERSVKGCSGRFILCDAVPFGACHCIPFLRSCVSVVCFPQSLFLIFLV